MEETFEVYSKPGCKYCMAASQVLAENNKLFKVHVVDRDFTKEELLEKFPSAKTYPQIETEDGKYIGGYEELVEYLKD